MWVQQTMSSRQLWRMREQSFQVIKDAINEKEQEIEREIMSQSSSIQLSQDDERSDASSAPVAATAATGADADATADVIPVDLQRRPINRVKRRGDVSSEDDGASLSKYRKFTTEQKIINAKENNSDSSTDFTDELSDESSNCGDKTQEQSNKDIVPETSCSSNGKRRRYGQKMLQMKMMESDVDCFDIPPQKESSSELIEKTNSQNAIETLSKYMKISSVAKIHSRIIHTSQFSSNDNFEINGNARTNCVDTFNNTLKQSKSELDDNNSENIQEPIDQTELSSSIANEVIVQGEITGDISNSKDDANGEEQETIQNLLSNAEFRIVPQPTSADNVVLKKNSIRFSSELLSETMSTENLDQSFIQQGNASQIHAPDYQVPSTSSNINEQNFNEISRADSVSDLNLAQLVLSLKQDIQELTRKIDKQENILGAVVQANEINLAPLFAQSFPEKYNLKLPFTTIEDFDKFNQDLNRNIGYCNEFITSLCSFIDNNVTLAKNILNMLRKYMSRDLAMLFTASKATGNKMVMKDTLFCKCLLQATKLTIRNGLLPLEHEKAFMKNLGLVISGAKGWHTQDDDRRNN